MIINVIGGSFKQIIIIGAAFLVLLLPLAGETSPLSVEAVGTGEWELSFQAMEDSRVLENIDRGLTAEILFDIRIYRNPFSLLGLRGGSLVMTRTVTTEGRWDRFNSRYTILRDGEIERFASSDEFRRRFFSLKDWRFDYSLEEGEVYQIIVRSRIVPMRLYPPFNILTPFQSLQGWRNSWSQAPLEENDL